VKAEEVRRIAPPFISTETLSFSDPEKEFLLNGHNVLNHIV